MARQSATQNGGRGWKFWAKVFAPVLASIAGLLTLRALGPDVVNQKQLSEWLRPLGEWAPIAFVFFLSVRPITLLPGQVFVAVGGLLFGTLMGSVYAMVGSFFAYALVFVLARKLGKPLMKRLAGNRYRAINTVARNRDFQFAALTTINPLLPTDVMIACASASGSRFWPTAAGVLAGTLPGTILTAQFGSALGQGKPLLTLVSGVGMVVSLVLGVWLGRKIVKEIGEIHCEQTAADRDAPKHQISAAMS